MKMYDLSLANDNQWEVVELKTEYVIDSFFFKEDAVKCMKSMNAGLAFNGDTPKFFVGSSFKNIPPLDNGENDGLPKLVKAAVGTATNSETKPEVQKQVARRAKKRKVQTSNVIPAKET